MADAVSSVVRRGAVCWAAALLFVARADAQVQQRPVPDWGLTLGLEAVSGTFQPRFNTPYAYGARGSGMGIGLGSVFKGHLLVGLDLGWAFFGGDRDFPPDAFQTGYSTRTTNAIFSSMYTGLITRAIGREGLGRKFWLGVRVGNGRWSGERRIEACGTCEYDPLPMRAGYYLSPFVVFGGGDKSGGGGFRLAYTRYMRDNAAMRDAVAFGFYFNFLNLD